MEPDQQDAVLPQDVAHQTEVQRVAEPCSANAVAAERGRVQEDAAPGRDRIALAEVRDDAGDPFLAEEDVRARDAEARHEAIERQAERLRVVGRHRGRGDQADVVVAVDGDAVGQRLVGSERLVQHAVAELLERPGRVPGLDDRGAGPRSDDVDREEVVVDDEQARRREVVARPQGMAERRDAAATPAGRTIGEDDERDRRMPAFELVPDDGQVASQHGIVGRGQDDPTTEWQDPTEREPRPNGPDADLEEQGADRPRVPVTARG